MLPKLKSHGPEPFGGGREWAVLFTTIERTFSRFLRVRFARALYWRSLSFFSMSAFGQFRSSPDPETDDLALSVIVPAHKVGPTLKRSLHAIKSTLTRVDELIVVLDGATGHLPEFEKTTVLQLEGPVGPAVARNAGASAAAGDIIVFVDSDVEVHTDTLEKIRQAFTQNPELAAVIGSYDDAPDDASLLSRYRNLLHHFTHHRSSRVAQTFWGACGAMRRDVFNSLGGFDERFPKPSVEDIELGYRAHQQGYRLELRKEILVKHLKSWGFMEIVRTDVLRRAAPWTRLLLEKGALPNDLNLRWGHRLSLLVVFLSVVNLILSLKRPELAAILPLWVICQIILNHPFYHFLRLKIGLRGMVASIAWHWVFYLCAGVGALIGVAQFVLSPRQSNSVSRLDPRQVAIETQN